MSSLWCSWGTGNLCHRPARCRALRRPAFFALLDGSRRDLVLENWSGKLWGWLAQVRIREAQAARLPLALLVLLQRSADNVDADMTLWQLLILICFGAGVGGALGEAGHAKAGFGGYALATTVGVVVGIGSAWTMWITHKIVVTSLMRRPDWKDASSQQEWSLRALYFSKFVWIVFAGFLGWWLSRLLRGLIS